ncbi:hypothetical protein HELRODRAFT_168999 [Helobdella robusta]|uniref:Uncharacterized protein n=1 Tax=Helobdella robusta TaxID=6412 RepID=T1F185_HELRO|nr:hypothetical protein HELRODRAFT_168999 [Helobdella robusta]ESO09062.1 hypothetical protein HELRODRAFT_168999 [Helobdella robusta]
MTRLNALKTLNVRHYIHQCYNFKDHYISNTSVVASNDRQVIVIPQSLFVPFLEKPRCIFPLEKPRCIFPMEKSRCIFPLEKPRRICTWFGTSSTNATTLDVKYIKLSSFQQCYLGMGNYLNRRRQTNSKSEIHKYSNAEWYSIFKSFLTYFSCSIFLMTKPNVHYLLVSSIFFYFGNAVNDRSVEQCLPLRFPVRCAGNTTTIWSLSGPKKHYFVLVLCWLVHRSPFTQ